MTREFPRPCVVASRCLGFDACRYDGAGIASPFLNRLRPYVRFQPVCPEVEIGLGTPRDPIRICMREGRKTLLQPSTQKDLTHAMHAFADAFLDGLSEVDGFILKSKSPSCGITDTKAFAGPASETPLALGAGLFAENVLARFGTLAVTDEAQLNEAEARAHFLTKLFALAGFRAVRKSKEPARLARYHTENKLLFLAYHQETMREMGRIAANHAKRAFGPLAADYENALLRALSRPPTRAAHVNALTHAAGHFSDKITSGEKKRFHAALEEYRAGGASPQIAFDTLREWIAHPGSPYLGAQTYFAPYPPALRGEG